MFTGIIEDIGKIVNLKNSAIRIETNLDGINIGDSIAVNGVCLTATKIAGRLIDFDYSPTTSKLTNISQLQKDSIVNLERALLFNSRLGGHIVYGHIDTTTRIISIKKIDNFYIIDFGINDKMKKYIVDKGFIAIDGISLTISECNNEYFNVTMIPETFNKTIFKTRKANDIVNIELDILAKYVEKMLNNIKNNKETDISLQMLKENGFV
ncbi:MAG: riboflavin synthase [Endomicrobiia bacterium]|nr:riboflavin synthase [Endomicrobiaceae bacterium]MDD3052942.1 riboflavin synthase [Endomicrobiaceae bacterium]MDD3922007.1 riboflavin synthase [Endomicrobiaceae bacterium]MDD5102194.1 riboflavin synthase [Endomicrobiaceae bacterium]